MSEVESLIKAKEETLEKPEKYQVHFSDWYGPYDLLLKVIEEKELNLFDLNIAILLDGYLQYLESLTMIDLDDAGEFLIVAATLAQIKSKMLLPKEETVSEEDEVDPRAELASYLIEYQKIKQAAERLREMPILGRDVFVKGLHEHFEGLDTEGHGTLFQLVKGFQKAVKRVEVRQDFQIEKENVSVSDRFSEIFLEVKSQKELSFDRLLSDSSSRIFIIASFLAVLELIRMKKIQIFQRDLDGPVFLAFREGATSEDVVHSEFDEVLDDSTLVQGE
jgi:segregation and condensation protein A